MNLAKAPGENFYWQRYLAWRDVPSADWYNWMWQYHHIVQTVEGLDGIWSLAESEKAEIKTTLADYKFASTPYYLSIINWENPLDPIRLQTIPTTKEMTRAPGDMADPLAEDSNMPVPGLVHRYPDRVLFLITTSCAMYCRFCTRRRIVLAKGHRTEREVERVIDYLKTHPEVRDIIISGGDALFVGDKFLEMCLKKIRAIPSIEIIRIASRIPVVCPMRIDDALVSMLKKYQPIYFMTHFNHPFELTDDARAACARLVDGGIPMFNQAVLLRGINSDVWILRALFHELLKIRVKPYYLYQCDMSEGIEHFRTPVAKGIEIIEALRGHTSGLAVPEFVIDAPGGGGKVPVMPQYLISQSDTQAVVRNYRGFISVYTEPQNDDCRCSTSQEFKERYAGLALEGSQDLMRGGQIK